MVNDAFESRQEVHGCRNGEVRHAEVVGEPTGVDGLVVLAVRELRGECLVFARVERPQQAYEAGRVHPARERRPDRDVAAHAKPHRIDEERAEPFASHLERHSAVDAGRIVPIAREHGLAAQRRHHVVSGREPPHTSTEVFRDMARQTRAHELGDRVRLQPRQARFRREQRLDFGGEQ